MQERISLRKSLIFLRLKALRLIKILRPCVFPKEYCILKSLNKLDI